MKLKISTRLDAPAGRVWAELQTPRLLEHVAAPLVRFVPVVPEKFPAQWEASEYVVRMFLFGAIPAGRQTIRISRWASGAAQLLRDNGSGHIARTWDHVIRVEPASETTTRYTDTVEVRAGLLTPLVWAFAQIFYRYRQRRWRSLVRREFEYGA